MRCIIHYQLPASADVYVHRSGRTARGEAEGISIALVGPKEQSRSQALWRALDREPPAEFPIDMSLMPAVSGFSDARILCDGIYAWWACS